MSTDNGVYILETEGSNCYEYRVSYTMAIDNIEHNPDYGRFNKEQLIKVFGNSVVYTNEVEALLDAMETKKVIEKSGNFIEYGICNIDASDMKFPEE
jgi:hypothetical protein